MPQATKPGRVFDDILDGYFPLAESLRQMMVRQGFARAWCLVAHAPFLVVEGDDLTAPVPLRLEAQRAGLIRRLVVAAAMSPDGIVLEGVGSWIWLTAPPMWDAELCPRYRLAEPAFVQGVGVVEDARNREGCMPVSIWRGAEPAERPVPSGPVWRWDLGCLTPGLVRTPVAGGVWTSVYVPLTDPDVAARGALLVRDLGVPG